MDNNELLRIMKIAHENGENNSLKELYNYAVNINAIDIIEWHQTRDIAEWSYGKYTFVLDFNGYRGNIKEDLETIKDHINGWYDSEMRNSLNDEQFEEGFTIYYSENNDFEVDFEVAETTIDNKTIYLKCIEGAC
jgi:hypothetical protein